MIFNKQKKADYEKIEKVIDSCRTLHHVFCACNMVDLFYKKYGPTSLWRKLDIESSTRLKWYLDMYYFQLGKENPNFEGILYISK